MPQHDYEITNADANSGINYRAAVNAALQALASNNSGATEPTVKYAYQLWADTTTGLLKIRNAANNAWITIGPLAGIYATDAEIITGTEAAKAIAPDQLALTRASAAEALAGLLGTKMITPLTMIVPNWLTGLNVSNATDTDHDITIATGWCMDSATAFPMRLGTAITKRIDDAWAAGTNAGGMFTGSVGNNTHYNVFIIRKDSDGTIDVGFDASLTAANKPAGYSNYRRIMSVWTDASANIRQFIQTGDEVRYTSPGLDISDTNTVTTRVLAAIPSPTGIKCKVLLNMVWNPSAIQKPIYISDPDATNLAGSQSATPLQSFGLESADGYYGQVEVITNTSNQISYRAGEAARTFRAVTIGWTDTRGK